MFMPHGEMSYATGESLRPQAVPDRVSDSPLAYTRYNKVATRHHKPNYPLLSDDDLVTVYNAMRAKWNAQ
jgi:hypothetical protein